MSCEKKRLIHRKKIRTCSKRLVTVLSTASLIGYIAALALNISVLSLCFTVTSTILSVLSFALNIWSLKDHFQKQKQLGTEHTTGKAKLTKICLDITSSVLFLIGGITSILPIEASITPFISTTFFILGCTFMVVRTMINNSQIDQNNNSKISNHLCNQYNAARG